MVLICLPQKADTQSSLFTVEKAVEIYLASCVLRSPPSVCMYVSFKLFFSQKGAQDL